FTNLTFFLDRSAIDLIPLGFPFATTSPCSHRAKVMTLYPPSGKRFFTVDRLGSSVLGSQRCEPAICTLASTSQLMACMLEQLAAISSAFRSFATYRPRTDTIGSHPAIKMRLPEKLSSSNVCTVALCRPMVFTQTPSARDRTP